MSWRKLNLNTLISRQRVLKYALRSRFWWDVNNAFQWPRNHKSSVVSFRKDVLGSSDGHEDMCSTIFMFDGERKFGLIK